MNPDKNELSKLKDYVKSLNSRKDGIVVVEGKRDEAAIIKLGYSGRICQFHSFKGLIRFADRMPQYKLIILLLDFDRKGRYLTRKITSLLQSRMSVDLSYRKQLSIITKGKIKQIEQLSSYDMNA